MSPFVKRMAAGLLAALLAALVSGCAAEPADTPREPLKIFINPALYDYHYRDYIEAAFPGLPVDIVWTDDPEWYLLQDFRSEMQRVIEAEKPDLVATDSFLYRRLADGGKLTDLSSYFRRSGMKEDDYQPGVMELLRSNNERKLYGMAPTFQASVLYYNKDLFDRFGVEPPTEGMSWEEMLLLALRFKESAGQDEGIVGYHTMYQMNSFDLMERIGQTEGVYKIDAVRGQVTMDTPSWKRIFNTVVKLHRAGAHIVRKAQGEVVDGETYFGPEWQANADLFGQGKAAMQIEYYPKYEQAGFRVGAVPPPVSETDRTRGYGLMAGDIFAIPANAVQKEQAWEVIRYLSGERAAQVLAALPADLRNGLLGTHRSFGRALKDPLLDGVFRMKPSPMPDQEAYVKIGREFFIRFHELIDKELAALLADKQTTDETLAHIQREGQALLDAALKGQ